MKNLYLLCGALLMLVACGGSPETEHAPPTTTLSVYHTWSYTDGSAGTYGYGGGSGLTLRIDGTYVGDDSLEFTSSTSANLEEETGTFTISGSIITFMPQDWTCSESYPAYAGTFALTDTSLTIAFSNLIIVYQIDTESPSTDFEATPGCFTQTGFIQYPLTPIVSSDQ